MCVKNDIFFHINNVNLENIFRQLHNKKKNIFARNLSHKIHTYNQNKKKKKKELSCDKHKIVKFCHTHRQFFIGKLNVNRHGSMCLVVVTTTKWPQSGGLVLKRKGLGSIPRLYSHNRHFLL